jgi:hypothetical protein
MKNDDWCIALHDDEHFGSDSYKTKEEAIAAGIEQAKEEGLECFWVGLATLATLPTISASDLLENLGESMYDDYGECSEDYLAHVEEKHEEELEEQLNAVFQAWSEKYDYTPEFWSVGSIERIEVTA